MRTLEQRLKFDLGLSIGRQHIVDLVRGNQVRRVLVHVGPRGRVQILQEPVGKPEYSTCRTVTGDDMRADGAIIIWGPEELAWSIGPPVALCAV